MTTLPAYLSKVILTAHGQHEAREEAAAFGLSLTEYEADLCAPDPRGMGVTIDVPCPCKGTGIVKRNGRTVYCRCAEGFEAAMAEQVELMTAYAERLRLYDEAQRHGHKPPFSAFERAGILASFETARSQHDWLEAQWEQLYG